MRLIYLANNRIPSEKANSLQIMQMCRAFQQEGAEVRLVVPHRMQPKVMRGVTDPFAYYGLPDRFPIVHLPCADTLEIAPGRLQPAAFALQSSTFCVSVAGYLVGHKADLYYSRDPLSTLLLGRAPESVRSRSVYEAHTFPKPGPRQRAHVDSIARMRGLVCITRGLANEYEALGIPRARILVAPDAVELERFASMPDRDEARRELGIPTEARVVCYTGHLYAWKGAHTIALASRHLPMDHLTYIVGGTAEDLSRFVQFLAEEALDRVKATGHVPPDRVPTYLAAADVVVLPNSGQSAASSRYTSPMKLFEYMAARRPIVASRLPAIEEVLRHGDTGWLVDADDPEALAAGIKVMTSSSELMRGLASRAYAEVQQYSWKSRAKSIMDFFSED
ncbi:MAG TPA: glycosyltransferase family 4 protein [Chloroflexota bacterium]|nr:glycosyltransferase family 4 protein [Chloroflexota bacterium]